MKQLISVIGLGLVVALMSNSVQARRMPPPPVDVITIQAVQTPPQAFKAWAQWVEKRVKIRDKAGHGPTVGSRAWMRVVDRKLRISAGGHGPDIGSGEWRRAVERKLGY